MSPFAACSHDIIYASATTPARALRGPSARLARADLGRLDRQALPKLLPCLDLIQEGTFGFVGATEKYDHRRGFMFSTYPHVVDPAGARSFAGG